MTGATRLVLVRHAAPVDEARTRVYGSLDYELSEAGREHAATIGRTLASASLAAVYSSPQRRATATAAAIASPAGLDLTTVEDLREIHFGELEGLDREEALRLYPDLANWTTAPDRAFPGGESVAGVWARAVAAARTIRASHPGAAVAVVSHSVPIRAILADALGVPVEGLFRIDQVYGGVSIVDWFGDRPLVRRLNSRDPSL